MKAYVICCNDAIYHIVLDDEKKAEKELKKRARAGYKGGTGSIR